MTPEAFRPHGQEVQHEQKPIDPVEAAQRSVTAMLIGTDAFNGLGYVNRVGILESALRESDRNPVHVYQTLVDYSGQGIQKAEAEGDAMSIDTLSGMRANYERSKNFFATLEPGAVAAAAPAAPTQTESLPPMTGAKGSRERIASQSQDTAKEKKVGKAKKSIKDTTGTTAQQPVSSESVGALLRQARTEARLSQGKLGDLAGTSQAIISGIERGTMKVSREKLESILAGLSLSSEQRTQILAAHEAQTKK